MLKEGTTTIGREKDNDIQLMVEDVSRYHAKIHNMPGAVEVEDLGSSNGTYVNGQRVETAALVTGSQVKLGPIVMVFEEVTSSGGLEEASPPRDYSTRAGVTTVRTRPAPSGKDSGNTGPKPLRPLRPIAPLKPRQ